MKLEGLKSLVVNTAICSAVLLFFCQRDALSHTAKSFLKSAAVWSMCPSTPSKEPQIFF